MRRPIHRVLTLTALCAAGGMLCGPSLAASGNGRIQGLVVEECADMVFVQVTLRDAGGALVGQTFSFSSGYLFNNVAPGTYTVTASDGSRSDTQTVVVTANQTTWQDLSLPCDQPGVVGFP